MGPCNPSLAFAVVRATLICYTKLKLYYPGKGQVKYEFALTCEYFLILKKGKTVLSWLHLQVKYSYIRQG